jgi:hypothetical protein
LPTVGAVGLVQIAGVVLGGGVVMSRPSIPRMEVRCASSRCLSADPSLFSSAVPSARTASSTLFRTCASLVAWSVVVVVVVVPVNSRLKTDFGS